MMSAFKAVFRKPWYIAIALIIAVFLFLFAIWFPNISIIEHVLLSSKLSFADKIQFLWNSLEYFTENFTLYSQAIVIFVSALSGINIAMVVFYLRKRILAHRASGIGFLGTIIGMLGFGCVACNSVILSSILGISATAVFIGILPFEGAEIGIIGILLLSVSIVLVSKKINNPMICKIKNK